MTPAVHCHPPEMSLTSGNSFLLDVLRGWRLLQAAALSKDEWRDILSPTGNKLDFESGSNALQILWDEQVMQPRMASHSSGYSHFVNWLEDDSRSDPSWAAASEWWTDDG